MIKSDATRPLPASIPTSTVTIQKLKMNTTPTAKTAAVKKKTEKEDYTETEEERDNPYNYRERDNRYGDYDESGYGYQTWSGEPTRRRASPTRLHIKTIDSGLNAVRPFLWFLAAGVVLRCMCHC
jgi:hypothetical protein